MGRRSETLNVLTEPFQCNFEILPEKSKYVPGSLNAAGLLEVAAQNVWRKIEVRFVATVICSCILNWM